MIALLPAYPRFSLRLSATALIVALLLLTGCGTLSTGKPAPIAAFSDNHRLQNWRLQGKIGIRDHQQAHSAYLNWQQCGDQYDIRISGPLGQGAAHLYGNDQQVTLAGSAPQPISARTPEQLLYQQLGWEIPLTQLFYWIRGIPDPDHSFRADKHGFKQSGWQLTFPSQTTIDLYTLPGKAVARHPDMAVTLILKNWDLQPACESIQQTRLP
jgi:outer membrane lipoprotein LolB